MPGHAATLELSGGQWDYTVKFHGAYQIPTTLVIYSSTVTPSTSCDNGGEPIFEQTDTVFDVERDFFSYSRGGTWIFVTACVYQDGVLIDSLDANGYTTGD